MSISLGNASVKGHSDKALLIKIDDEDYARWIPKSVIHADSEVYKADSEPGELIVEEWWAEKEGLT